MREKINILYKYIFLMFMFCNTSFGQNHKFNKNFNQKDFEKNEVLDNTYHLWWYKNKWFPEGDTIPYLVNDKEYKGVANYGVEFKLKDHRVFNFIEDFSMFYLDIEFKSCTFYSNDSIIEIEGSVKGGWSDLTKNGWNNKDNYIDVFIGELNDTINPLYYKNRLFDNNEIEVYHKSKKVKNYVVLDTFPSFYFKKYIHTKSSSNDTRYFKIRNKINEKSIIAFGAISCYSRIYDIGSMVFFPDKNKNKKIEKQKLGKKQIIVKNKLLTDLVKEESSELIYYKYTDKAEDYILKRQYAYAKKEYIALNEIYSNLFARDIHNAIRSAVLSRDYQNAFFWGEKLAQKGIGINYFNAKVFTSLKKNKQWDSFSKKYDSIYNEFQNNKSTKLKQEIEKLVNEDQSVYGLENRKEPEVRFETTKKTTEKLIALIKSFGYPSEDKIGLQTINDTVLNFSPDYYVLIKHAQQQKPDNLKILNKLLNESEKVNEYDGKRSANNVFHYNCCYHIYKGNLYISNSCRLDDLEVRKIKFIFNNPHGFIIHNNNFIIAEYNKKNPDVNNKYYKENFRFVENLTDDWEFYLNN